MKRLLTGLQPSGSLHLGNYFGALKPFLDTYENYDSTIMVADLHALTTVKDGALLRKNIIDVVRDYLAIGINPEKATIFQQSRVMEHAELAWVLECLVTVPFLMQAHSYKDKTEKGLEANVGLFAYPMLMAADILLYDTDIVPVGQDQKQHVEYTREAVRKFNVAYSIKDDSQVFVMPNEMILEGSSVIPGIDGKKMSKSYKNTIPLFATREEITKAVKSIVTDSSGDFPQNVYNIHKLIKSEDELKDLYANNKGKYGILKEALIKDLDDFISPMRERRNAITDEYVIEVLNTGYINATSRAKAKMDQIRKIVGTSLN